jgi:hypothetical protein
LRAFDARVKPSPQKNLYSSLGRKNKKILTASGAMASSKLHIRQEASMKRWVGMCVASLADCWLTDGDGSHADDVECRSAAPMPIPLPASWGFLLIAVGSLAGMRAVRNARSA